MVLAVPAALLGEAQQPPPKPVVKMEAARPTSPADGAEMFRSYCAACHGVAGQGDGPAAPALTPRPSDLTLFARRRGGKFVHRDFEDKLNGKAMVPAHGSTSMPIWGPIFRQLGNEQIRMYNLTAYVESLQAK
jgi:mono/diheme cytochrome c family protein